MLFRSLFNLTEEVIYKTRKMNLAGRQIHLGLSGQHQSWHRHLTLKYFINHTQEMFDFCIKLYQQWPQNFSIIKFSVRLSLLQPLNQTPISLLPQWQKQEKISQSIDKINDKFGLFTIKSGLLVKQKIIMPEVTGFLGDKHFQFL